VQNEIQVLQRQYGVPGIVVLQIISVMSLLFSFLVLRRTGFDAGVIAHSLGLPLIVVNICDKIGFYVVMILINRALAPARLVIAKAVLPGLLTMLPQIGSEKQDDAVSDAEDENENAEENKKNK
ncbi:hypothetical protein BCR33DRAFT_713423, partial [Rhizoclosmatium globosum]